MQSSFRDRTRDLGFHHQKPSSEDIPDCKPMVLSMNSESYQANGHNTDSFELGREGSSAVGMTKKSLPANGKKTKGRVKIKMEFIDNKLRRYTTFSKRKTGIMKKVSNNNFLVRFRFFPSCLHCLICNLLSTYSIKAPSWSISKIFKLSVACVVASGEDVMPFDRPISCKRYRISAVLYKCKNKN